MTAAAEREFDLTRADFEFIAATVARRTGISLGPNKRNLVYGRLARRLRALGLDSFRQYCDILKGPGADSEIGMLVNAITTNMTAFFREPHHFDHLRTVLAERPRTKPAGRLRIWSAGCSSGEEPYSIGMTLLRALTDSAATRDARILATDIDTGVLAIAEAGTYPEDRIASIPAAERQRYAIRRPDGAMAMSETLRALITFRPLNLLDDWPMQGPFDAIFCRNVAIYFDKQTRERLFDRFADFLGPGGWLYIGHSETLFNVTGRFVSAGRTIYQRAA
jgi:chemotaxis protein methyltransferase CheR